MVEFTLPFKKVNIVSPNGAQYQFACVLVSFFSPCDLASFPVECIHLELKRCFGNLSFDRLDTRFESCDKSYQQI